MGIPRGQPNPPNSGEITNISNTIPPLNHIYSKLAWKANFHGNPWGQPHSPYSGNYKISQKPFRSPPLNHLYSKSAWQGKVHEHRWGLPHPRILKIRNYLKNCSKSPHLNHKYSKSAWLIDSVKLIMTHLTTPTTQNHGVSSQMLCFSNQYFG